MRLRLNLTHSHTPDTLACINQSLDDCVDAAELDEGHLQILIDQRAVLVNQLLKSMTAIQSQQFAQAEMTVNQRLIDHVTELRASAKKALSSVAKSSRGIKKYQQV
jgi:hypothetical protein